MEHRISAGSNGWLVTYTVDDAITMEHAISLASHQAYADGIGSADLYGAKPKEATGQHDVVQWFEVSFLVSDRMLAELAWEGRVSFG